MKEMLLDFISYNSWANRRVTDFILKNCSAEQIDLEVKSSFPSLKKTLLHIWGAESIWLQRLKGDSPAVWKGSSYAENLESLCGEIAANNDEFHSFVKSCGEPFLRSPFKYSNLEGKEFTNSRSDAILHCMNHSTFHRGQIITILRQLDFEKLFSTDYITYCRERE
ncbi:MAG: DinB family protein [Bacteroidia bacterium]|nr:DinB family protein [Bacteroidia bacterium]